MKRRVALSLDADLLGRVDARTQELGQSRTTFVERALESALAGKEPKGGVEAPVQPSPARHTPSPAPTRTPAMDRQAKLNAAKAGKR